MKHLSYITGALLMVGLILYAVDMSNNQQGALLDANEYLVTHGMIPSLPSYCVIRPNSLFICRATPSMYLLCRPRGMMAVSPNATRCSPVDIPQTR